MPLNGCNMAHPTFRELHIVSVRVSLSIVVALDLFCFLGDTLLGFTFGIFEIYCLRHYER